jgi:hypothetical protein
MSPDEPIKPETEERLRDAMQSYATRREPDDGWETIAGRVDRRWWQRAASPRVWGPGLVLAAAAAVLLFFVMGGEGSEQSEELEVGDPTAEENQQSIIAITADDKLVEIVPGGETREIFDLSGLWGRPGARPGGPSIANPDLMRRPAVLPDGSVLVSRQGSAGSVDCQPDGGPLDPAGAEAAQDWNGVQLWRIFTDGRTETFYGSFAPSVSPDGTEVATVQPDLCNGGFLVNIVTVDGSVPTLEIDSGRTPTSVAPAALVWEDDDRLSVVYREGDSLTRVLFDAGSLEELDRGSVAQPGPTSAVGPAGDGGQIVAHTVASSQLHVDLLALGGDPQELFTIAPRDNTTWYTPLSVDASASNGDVLLTAAIVHPRMPADPYAGPLFLWEGGGEPRVIAEDIVDAAWARPLSERPSTAEPSTPETTISVTGLGVEPTHPPMAIITFNNTIYIRESASNQTPILELGLGVDPYVGADGVAEFAVASELDAVYVPTADAEGGECGGDLRRYEVQPGALGDSHESISPRAANPSLSPDGRMLAYVEFGGFAPVDCPQTLVVRDLETGDERRWEGDAEVGGEEIIPPRQVQGLVWAPDSQALYFQLEPENTYYGVSVLEGEDIVLASVRDLTPPNTGDYWSPVGIGPAADLWVISNCVGDCPGPSLLGEADSVAGAQELSESSAKTRFARIAPEGSLLYIEYRPGVGGPNLLHVRRPDGDDRVIELMVLGATWVG